MAERLQGYKVMVAGAAGGTGRRCVEVLREAGVPVRAMVRDVDKARAVLKAAEDGGLEVVRGDVTRFSTLPAAMADCNALIIATGASDPKNPLGPFDVDFQGTLNLVAMCRQMKSIKKVVLVSSIGAEDLLNPLNLFGGVLFWKKQAEGELQRSGLPYTVVRPGGLKSELRSGETRGNVVMKGPGALGFPPKKSGSILRRQVAECCVAALVEPAATGKVCEIIAERDAPFRSWGELFEGVEQ